MTKHLSLLLLTLLPFTLLSQEEKECGATKMRKEWYKLHPEMKGEDTKTNLKTTSLSTSIEEEYKIPVIFHILETPGTNPGDPSYITEQQIIDFLAAVNTDMKHIDVQDGDDAIQYDLNLELVLSKQDAVYEATTGIVRYQDEITDNLPWEIADDFDMKDIILEDVRNIEGGKYRFPNSKYLNIYVVNHIQNSIYGYAPQATMNYGRYDGIVLRGNLVKTASTGTMIHEFGHYLNLYHTFDGYCINNNCERDGDKVCDTPPDNVRHGDLINNSCHTDEDDTHERNPYRASNLGGLGDVNDMTKNFMDYSSYDEYFTVGQVERMYQALAIYKEKLPCSETNLACLEPCSTSVDLAIGVPEDLTAGTLLTFDNLSTDKDSGGDPNNAYTYTWNFGDIHFSSPSQSVPFQAVNNTYMQGGVYPLEVIATNAEPTCRRSTTTLLEIECNIVPQIGLDNEAVYGRVNVDLGDEITFTNMTAGNIQQQKWYLDGVEQSTTGSSFTKTYNSLGSQMLELKVFNGTCWQLSNGILVDVGNNCDGPTGNEVNNWAFDYEKSNSVSPKTYKHNSRILSFNSGKHEEVDLFTTINNRRSIAKSAICNDRYGNVLLNVSGVLVLDRLGNELNSMNQETIHYASQNQIFIPGLNDGKIDFYYLIEDGFTPETNEKGLRYTKIDMKKGAISTDISDPLYGQPLGEVTQDWTIFDYNEYSYFLGAVHIKKDDFLLIASKPFTRDHDVEVFFYLVNHNGISRLQEVKKLPFVGPYYNSYVGLKHFISPNADLIAFTNRNNGLLLYRFYPEKEHGKIGELIYEESGQHEEVEFSPNGGLLYTQNGRKIYQYDIRNKDSDAIKASKFKVGETSQETQWLKTAPNGRIYIHTTAGYNIALFEIKNPNATKEQCNYNPIPFIKNDYGNYLPYPSFVNYGLAKKITINGPECVPPGTKDISVTATTKLLPNEDLEWSVTDQPLQAGSIREIGSDKRQISIDAGDEEGLFSLKLDYISPCGNSSAFYTLTVDESCRVPVCPNFKLQASSVESVEKGHSLNYQFDVKTLNGEPIDNLGIVPINPADNIKWETTNNEINTEYITFENDQEVHTFSISGYYDTDIITDTDIIQKFQVTTGDGCFFNVEDIKVPMEITMPPNAVSIPQDHVIWEGNFPNCDELPLSTDLNMERHLTIEPVDNVASIDFSFSFDIDGAKALQLNPSQEISSPLFDIQIINQQLVNATVVVECHGTLKPEFGESYDIVNNSSIYSPDYMGRIISIPFILKTGYSHHERCTTEPVVLNYTLKDNNGSPISIDKAGGNLPIRPREVCDTPLNECYSVLPQAILQYHVWDITGKNADYVGASPFSRFYIAEDGEVILHSSALSSDIADEGMYFNASDKDRVTLPDPGIDFENNDFTIEAYINIPESPQQIAVREFPIILSNNPKNNSNVYDGFVFGLTRAGTLNFFCNGNPNYSNISLNDGKCHHVAVTVQHSQSQGHLVSYIVDGVTMQTYTFTGSNSSLATGEDLIIGGLSDAIESSWGSGGVQIEGFIKEIRIWDRARGETEIAQTKDITLLGGEDGLVGYWKLNETSGQTVYDYALHDTGSPLHGFRGTSSSVQSTDPQLTTFSCEDEEPEPCSQNLNLRINSITENSAEINWDETPDADYEIKYAAQFEDWTTIPISNQEQYTLNGLSPNTKYALSIRSMCEGEFLEWSDQQYFKTTFPCNTPDSLYSTLNTDNLIEVFWNEIEHAHNYTVHYNNGTTYWEKIAADNSLVLTDLQPNQTYYWNVETNCTPNTSDVSVTETFNTPKDVGDSPSNLALSKNGLTFNKNENDLVTIPHIDSYNIGSGDFTVEAWVRYDGSQESYPAIFSNRASGASGFLFFTNSQGQLWINMDGANYALSNTPSLYDGLCHHVAFTRNGNIMEWFIDGELKRSSTANTRDLTTNHDIWIGLDVSTYNTAMNGSIKEVRFWNVGKDEQSINARKDMQLKGNENGLIGYWRLNENTGQIAFDLSTNANNGVLGSSSSLESNDPHRSTNSCGVTTPFSLNELEFSKNDKDKIIIPHLPEYSIGSNDFTVEAWVKYNGSQTTYPAIFSNRTGHYSGFLFYTNPQGRLWVNMNGANYGMTSGISLYDNEYHHVAFTRHGSVMKWFVDGELLKTQNASYQNISTEREIWLGHDISVNNTAFNGVIKEVRFWNTGRSDAEIFSNKDQQLYGFENGLIGYWRLDEGEGQDANDYSFGYNIGHLGSTYDIELNDPEWTFVSSSQNTNKQNYSSADSITQIKIYPNPFDHELIIETGRYDSSINIISLTILDSQGKVVYTDEIESHTQITLGDNFPPGLYLVHINTGDQVEVYKLVKQ